VVAAPFASVLAEIASLSGASVTGLDPADVVPTTITCSDLPLADALERLLKDRNHLLMYGKDSRSMRVRRIVLLNGGTTVSLPAAASAAAPERAPAADSRPDRPDAVLAEALDLLTSGLALEDPALRRQLLDEIATWELDAPSRSVLLARLSGDPDPEVREAALRVLQGGRPDVSSIVGVRERRHGAAARNARARGI
jgi:hypothetical protein